MIKNLLYGFVGVCWSLAYFQLSLPVPTGLLIPEFHPWVGAALFFTYPLIPHFMAARWLSHKCAGQAFVAGWLLMNLCLLTANWENYLYSSRAFATCGNARRAWARVRQLEADFGHNVGSTSA